MAIYLVTGNKNKLREFEQILGFKLNHIDLDLDEIQAVDAEEVVEHKVREAYQKISARGGSRQRAGKKSVLVEDTGLYFEAWNGLPGALIKLFGQAVGYRNLPRLLKKNRRAKAKTVIGYFDGKNYKNFIGEISGTISKSPKGKTNFGWDIIFIPKGNRRTFAQMTAEEKNKISMRKVALEKLRKFLGHYSNFGPND